MKNNKKFNALNLILLVILSLTLIGTTQAQSTDIDSATVLTSQVIEGEGDGKGETVYYTFTATKGDMKVTVDAKTDSYSTNLKVTLMDEDGKELVPVYVTAKSAGQREVATKHFVREQKVIVKITTWDDAQVKLLTYKIKLDGAFKVEVPVVAAETTQTIEQSNPVPSTEQTTSTDSSTTPTTEPTTTTPKMKDKVKAKVKNAAKQALKSIIDF